MADGRIPLKKGYQLSVDKKYTIESVLGRGGSCIVYEAYYEDNQKKLHRVRIKECYPYLLNLSRKDDSTLNVTENVQTRFDEEKKRFVEAYKKNADLRNVPGLVNLTVNATEIYEANNTLYYAMEYNEGENYLTYGKMHPEETLHAFFGHMKALVEGIGKYHANGLLHLDIKPENVLLLSEGQIVLFDFDSVVTEEELRSGKVRRFSVSDGFAAPEQVNGWVDKIGRHTDVYAIGAMVYWKLFEKKPDEASKSAWAKYDFQTMVHQDKRYQPILFRKLDEFLHKTIVAAPKMRWQGMEEVLRALEKLTELSDLEKVYVPDKFNYTFQNFVGRSKELAELEELFTKERLVFLSGIGGIGKTELARRYAHQHRESFRTVVFATFRKSIVETVCSEEFTIANYKEDASLPQRERFEQKLGALQELLTEEDLVILDNFDVEEEGDLEELLERCACKFLITTRADYRDYNYAQLSVEEITDIEELLRLFKMYDINYRNYTEEEQKCVEKIIRLVENHTMAVELVAKYVVHAMVSPKELYEKLLEKEGFAVADEVQVIHVKDKKSKAESVKKHLMSLFDMSFLLEQETELLISLSIFGFRNVRRERLLKWCDFEGNKEALRHLIQRGWVRWDEKKDNVSLHKIILDMVCEKGEDIEKKCPHICSAMLAYAKEETLKLNEKNKWHVLMEFADTMWGFSETRTELMLLICEHFFESEVELGQYDFWMERVYHYMGGLDIGLYEPFLYDDPEIREILGDSEMDRMLTRAKKTPLLKIMRYGILWMKYMIEDINRGGIFYDYQLEAFLYYGQRAYCQIDELQVTEEEKLNLVVEISKLYRIFVDVLIEEGILKNCIEDTKWIRKFLNAAKECLEIAEEKLEISLVSVCEKKKFYEMCCEFYRGKGLNYGGIAREPYCKNKVYMKKYVNVDKAVAYWEKLRVLELERVIEEEELITNLQHWGWEASYHGEYESAIQFLQRAFYEVAGKKYEKIQEWELVNIVQELMNCYEKLGRREDAIVFIRKEETVWGTSPSVYIAMICSLINSGKKQVALTYIEKYFCLLDKKDKTYSYWRMAGLMLHYQCVNEKKGIWKECLANYRKMKKISEDEIAYIDDLACELIVGFYELYLPSVRSVKKRMQILCRLCSFFANNLHKIASYKLYELFLKESMEQRIYEKKELECYTEYYYEITKALLYGEESQESLKEALNEFFIKCEDREYKNDYTKASMIYSHIRCLDYKLSDIEDEKEREKIQKKKKELAQKVDYYQLAINCGKGKSRIEQYRLLREAYEVSREIGRRDTKVECIEKILELHEGALGIIDVKEMEKYWEIPEKNYTAKNLFGFYNGMFGISEEENSIFAYWHYDVKEYLWELDTTDKKREAVQKLYNTVIAYYGYELFSKDSSGKRKEYFMKWKGRYEREYLLETFYQEFARRVEELAENMQEVGDMCSMMLLLLSSIYIGLTEEPDIAFLRAVFPENDESVALLTEKLSEALNVPASWELVEPVLGRAENALELIRQEADLAEFQEISGMLEDFLGRYQDVESKH